MVVFHLVFYLEESTLFLIYEGGNCVACSIRRTFGESPEFAVFHTTENGVRKKGRINRSPFSEN